jgi:(2Fe-2S) ferredoxin
MPRYERHVFVCTNRRPDGHPKGCCATKGSDDIAALLKAELKSRGLQSTVRANKAGCLDACEFGTAMVIYPDGIWYGGVRKEDIPEIVEKTILNGELIDRLLIPDVRYAPAASHYPILVVPRKTV